MDNFDLFKPERQFSMPNLPKLLFVSPFFPDVTGYGSAMRAGAILEGLSASCQVYLLIIPIQDPYRTTLPSSTRSWCREHCIVRLSRLRKLMDRFGSMIPNLNTELTRPDEWRYASTHTVLQAAQAFRDVHFDYLHVFRLYMMPFAKPYLDTQKNLTARYLDLDDIESITRRRLADLYRANGLHTRALREQHAAELYARLERELLPQFDGVYVCSRQDKLHLNTLLSGQNIFVLPNIVRLPLGPRPPKSDGPFTFLFVGNLNYYPNEDAIVYFLEHVLPFLRRRAKHPFCFIVIGSGQCKRLRNYRQLPEWRHVGFVNDLAPYYDQADAVVVPLRAGGGTRIKVLEAFSFKRPVISTTVGVEGLEVENEKHALIADDPQRFAEQCCRLMEDNKLSSTLITNAFERLIADYTPEAMQCTLSRIMSARSPC